ncbi:MAG: hypothetical protein L3K03_04070 [Thermoplasmata archaeon]|nr:hypothetical protein [Thermoplasmata archaeon]
MTYSTVRLCSSRGAFEAIPQPRLTLDLGAVRQQLEGQSIPVQDARVMLIVQLSREVTVARDGRIMIKTRDPEEAAQVLADLFRRTKIDGLAAGQ